MKKISFLLPGLTQEIVGGYKVVYELANRFVNQNYEVTIIYITPLKSWKAYQVNIGNLIFPKREETIRVSWFPLDKRVKQEFIPFSAWRHSAFKKSNYLIATSYETAQVLINLPKNLGQKIYFIQSFEDWSGTKKEVEETWKAPFDKKIVIASWMIEKAKSLDQKIFYWQMGIDFNTFFLEKEIATRDPYTISLMYHHYDLKGFPDGLRAFEIARQNYPKLKLHIFSTFEAPVELKNKYHFSIKPNMREFFNNTSIFLSPSWKEGCHLPPLEAMACGACVVGTRVGSLLDFAISHKTALISEPRDPIQMAANLKILLDKPEMRIQIAENAYKHIQKYTWEKAFNSFLKIIEN